MPVRDELEELIEGLKTQRDEIAVKIHLARKDVRDEWEALEKKLEHLRGRAELIGREATDAAADVRQAARLVVDEIKKGYERIRKVL